MTIEDKRITITIDPVDLRTVLLFTTGAVMLSAGSADSDEKRWALDELLNMAQRLTDAYVLAHQEAGF